jgi:hypothetical protein
MISIINCKSEKVKLSCGTILGNFEPLIPKEESIPESKYTINALTTDEESPDYSFNEDWAHPDEDKAEGQMIIHYRNQYLKRNYPDLLECDWNEGLCCYCNRFNHHKDDCKYKKKWIRSDAYA